MAWDLRSKLGFRAARQGRVNAATAAKHRNEHVREQSKTDGELNFERLVREFDLVGVLPWLRWR